MTFQPVLPLGGYSGWRFLSRTLPQQQAAFVQSAPVQRATDYFKANIAKATTPEALVKDRRLLEVALGAFGLKDDLNSRAFIQRVLEGGTTKLDALASRLADKRYATLAREFGYGDLGARVKLEGFADKIVARYEAQSFQEAVGAQDDNMRLALNLPGGLAEVAKATANPRAQWFSVMGNPPLRAVFERALGLPKSFGALDIDQQLSQLQSRAEAAFGTARVDGFTDPARQEKLVRLFLLRSDAQATNASPAAMALQLLRR
jgi:hypothetical protein